jgi:hypothetical protein
VAGEEVEVNARLRRRLEEEYGMREAAYLMDRPAGGWESLATKEYVDLRLHALEHRLVAEIERRFRIQTTFLVSAMIVGLGLFGLLVR